MRWEYGRKVRSLREAACASESSPKSEGLSRCWRRPSVRGFGSRTVSLFTSATLALSVAGCPEEKQDAASVACSTEEILVPLRGEVDAPRPRDKSSRAPSIWVTVHEGHSIASCGRGLMTVVQPGKTLATFRADDSGMIALDLERTVFVDEPAPALSVTVLFDEDHDGVCDQGELSGYAEVADDGTIGELFDVQPGCPARL